MWIRGKNKESLLPIGKLMIFERYNDDVEIEGYYITCLNTNVGDYKTKERCFEILDDIQRFINNYNSKYHDKIRSVFEMPQE